MIRPSPPASPGESEIFRAELERALADRYGSAHSIVRVDRRPSPYQSTASLEEVDVSLSDHGCLRLILKRHAATTSGDELRSRPGFLFDPEREIGVYRAILGPAGVAAPEVFGSLVDRSAGRYWLLLERVGGRELYQVDDPRAWTGAARWLAALHGRFKGYGRATGAAVPLPTYDREHYLRWIRRAVRFAPPNRREALETLRPHHEAAVELLLRLPTTLLHGEFYASNILVRGSGEDVEVIPVDWETAAIGPGVIDLAALTSGSWTEEQLRPMEDAYHQATAELGWWKGNRDSFTRSLAAARLHIAVQWLGWSRDWIPPTAHRRDWLGDALRIAERSDFA